MPELDGGTWQDHLETETRSQSWREETLSATVPGLTLLAHPDVQRVGERAALAELSSGREDRLSRLAPEFSLPGEARRRPLADPHLSRRAVRFTPWDDGGIRLSCRDTPIPVMAGGEPVAGERCFTAAEVAAGVVLLLAQRVVLLLHRFRPVFDRSVPDHGLVGTSDAMTELRRRLQQVADLDVPVLLRGETGTGKELLAEAIHRASRRRGRPYLTVNLGAVAPSLAAAELFGASKGAFTGADRKRSGYFSRAHGGTLFLDEIGEVPGEVQPLLLRALENGEIQPVGAEETQRVDVRTIAATDADLEAAIAAGRFRSPLLHRLAGYVLRVPALCERREDIGPLFFHFLRQELDLLGDGHRLADAGDRGWVPAPFVARLAAAPWPGNVRQLRNVARHLAVDNRGAAEARVSPQLELLLTAAAPEPPTPAPPAAQPAGPRRRGRLPYRSPSEVSAGELRAALKANRWEPGATARQLGISRPALYLLIDACPDTRKAADLERAEIEQARERCGGSLAGMAEILEVSPEGLKRRIRQLADR